MVICYLSLGSNQGDRSENLSSAFKALRLVPHTRFMRSSKIYESSPVGTAAQADYLNACAKIETRLSPIGLLIEFKRIEAALGRKPGSRWAPRPIDIDLLFYNDHRLRTYWLRLPHPRALKRKFVLMPLAEIWPRARHWLENLNAPSQNVNLHGASKRQANTMIAKPSYPNTQGSGVLLSL